MNRPTLYDRHGWIKSKAEQIDDWRAYANDLERENAKLQKLVESLAERVFKQSELLSKRAERKH